MELLLIAAVLFLLSHLGIASTPLRAVLVDAFGEGPYLALYSLIAALTLGLMIYAYARVPHTDFLWYPSRPLYALAMVLMLFASILLAMGLLTRNPTAVGMGSAVHQGPVGVFRITRHPVQWAFLLWAIAHLLANGDVATVILAGSIGLLSGVGMAAIDARYRRRDDPAWRAFYASSSTMPFLAIARGRTTLSLRDINWLTVAAGLGLYLLFWLLHGWITGVPLGRP